MTINGSFIFCTLNQGTKMEDYTQLFPNKEEATDTSPNFGDLSTKNPDDVNFVKSINVVRDKLLGETAIDLARVVDVFALQEVSGDDRADILEFKNKGFQIIRPPKKNPQYASQTDTAIAINPDKFEVTNDSNKSFNDKFSGRDFAGPLKKDTVLFLAI